MQVCETDLLLDSTTAAPFHATLHNLMHTAINHLKATQEALCGPLIWLGIDPFPSLAIFFSIALSLFPFVSSLTHTDVCYPCLICVFVCEHCHKQTLIPLIILCTFRVSYLPLYSLPSLSINIYL